ncbi:M14 family metallopeptidase [Massilia sp. TS11]|uniref:M14 family metallopeptidase n=1 Tax=Massilia sp. TS11 TaxID=2908003 RepID=UPI001EDA6656|nr:M14 family metallopeptidase [Massilia sp. TS11]MCG2584782.1 M14 family metallopeptidase [Massilia sp. TS11]
MIRRALTLALLAVSAHAWSAVADLRTESEKSGFTRTGRYEEVEALCAAFQKAYPREVRCTEFGRSPEGRPMMALIVTRTGAMIASEARRRNIPVVLMQGGIHAGEIDGKDAGFLALREVLEGKQAKGALDKQVLIFVPVFNVDGHERFGKWNRPNQRGPVEMGWRATAQNYNLNRDYMKADTPEMRAMLALVNAWDPVLYVDLHVTDGAKFEHDVSIQVEPVYSGDSDLRRLGAAVRDKTIEDINKKGSLAQPFYMSFVETDNPASGFEDSVSDPRFSTGYFQLRNRMAMLVETHSWKDYPTRVRITHNSIISVLEQMKQDGARWQQIAQEADNRQVQSTALTYKASDKARMIDFRGYAYTRTPSEVSGALMTRYDESQPQIWRVPVRDDVQPLLVASAPGAGYIVPAAWSELVAKKLAQHAISFRTIGKDLAQFSVQTFRADEAKFGGASFEGHQNLKVHGAWKPEARDIGKGALFVPVAQPKARLVMHLFEPQGPDSLNSWGFFNTAYERKEYMEEYVAEEVAREMLARDAALAAQFKQLLESDAAFAASPARRLEFFARRHSSWDERYRLYPVLRTDLAP